MDSILVANSSLFLYHVQRTKCIKVYGKKSENTGCILYFKYCIAVLNHTAVSEPNMHTKTMQVGDEFLAT